MAKHGRGSGSGANPTARAPTADSKAPAVAQPAKRRRGAPQTFSSKLYKILQDAQLKESSPVGWCLEGKSFTVHNDKDFETRVLAANYRHGKFSSFQRQLNMYGFRKVADCSDRTYSHPYFRRDKPELLAHVRRVVNDPLGTANANASLNAEGNPVSKAPPGVKGPLVLVPTATLKEEEEEEGREGEGGRCNGRGGEARPARKKPRRVGGVLSSSTSSGLGFPSPGLKPKQVSAAAAAASGGAGGSSTSRGHGSRSSPVFPYPPQRQAGAGAGAGAAQLQRLQSSWPQQQRQQQQQQQQQPQQQQQQEHHRRLHEQEQILQAACSAAAGKPNPSRQQFSSSMWHQHTGRWGGETLMTGGGGGGSGGTSWTTTSSSASSSVDDVSSPVLLPISPADLDCSGYVPPFRLQPDVSTRLPDTRRSRNSGGGGGGIGIGIGGNNGKPPVPVSPAPGSFSSSAAALFDGRGGKVDAWNGGGGTSSHVGAAAAGSFVRSSTSMLFSETTTTTTTQHVPGLYGGGGVKGGGGGSDGVGDGGRAAIDESNALSLDKAFGFGTVISRPASFDLSLERQEVSPRNDNSNQTGRAQSKTPTTNTPGGPRGGDTGGNNNNAVAPVTPTAVDGSAWDLACLGGPGWGSPDTTESPAASVWAAIPPLTVTESEQPPPTSSSGQTWTVLGVGGGAAVVEGGGGGSNSSGRGMYGSGAHLQYQQQQQSQQQQQQSCMYNRNICASSVFSPAAAAAAGHGASSNLNGNGNGNGTAGDSTSGGVGLSSLDWALLGDESTDPTASVAPTAPPGFADGGSACMGGVDVGVARRASPVYPTLASGAATGGHL